MRTGAIDERVTRPARLRFGAVAVVAAFSLGRLATAQVPSEEVDQILDRPAADIDIEAPLEDALSKLGEKTGLVFQLDKTVADFMPYGTKTKLNFSIRRLPVREALTRVFDGLGLRMEVRGDKVLVLPAAVLARVGRRLTAGEAGLLSLLAGNRWNEGRFAYRKDFRLVGVTQPSDLFYAAMNEQLRSNPEATAMHQLDVVTQRLGWTWRPEGEQIVFESRRDDVSRRLDRPLDLSYQRAKLDDVLIDLGKRIGVVMLFEPGSLQKVDARDRAVDLVQRGATLRQTLERICGATGLRYEIVDEGVRVLGPLGEGQAGGAAPGSELARMTIEIRPGIFVEVLLPVQELPPDLRMDLERKLKDLFGRTVRAGEQKPR
jgi:hypothetical protein